MTVPYFLDGSSLRAAMLLSFAFLRCTDHVPPPVVAQLSEDLLVGVDRNRTHVSAVDIEELAPAFRLELPDERASSFRMRSSVALVAFGAPDCTVLIGDASDMAIHWFGGSRARYLHSVFLGGRDAPLVTDMTDMEAVTPDVVAVSDRGSGKIVRVDAAGQLLSVIELPIQRAEGTPLPANRIALGPGSTVVEQPLWRGNLADHPGMVRVWKGDGRLGHYLGNVVKSGGREFAETLSLGDFFIRGDTLWTLRQIDGRIRAYNLSEAESSAFMQHDLPLFFQMDPPTIVLRDSISGETAVTAARHADSFAMDPHGNFLVEQFREDGTPVLGTMGWDGTGYRVFALGVAQIRALAATVDHLFAAVVLPGERDTVVLAYRSPFSGHTVEQATCHDAAFLPS